MCYIHMTTYLKMNELTLISFPPTHPFLIFNFIHTLKYLVIIIYNMCILFDLVYMESSFRIANPCENLPARVFMYSSFCFQS